MNATATVWDFEEEFDDLVDMIPANSVPARDSGILRRRRSSSRSPLEQCLEDCARHGESVVIIEDTEVNSFFEAENAGEIEVLEILVTGREYPISSGKRAKIQILSRKSTSRPIAQ